MLIQPSRKQWEEIQTSLRRASAAIHREGAAELIPFQNLQATAEDVFRGAR